MLKKILIGTGAQSKVFRELKYEMLSAPYIEVREINLPLSKPRPLSY